MSSAACDSRRAHTNVSTYAPSLLRAPTTVSVTLSAYTPSFLHPTTLVIPFATPACTGFEGTVRGALDSAGARVDAQAAAAPALRGTHTHTNADVARTIKNRAGAMAYETTSDAMRSATPACVGSTDGSHSVADTVNLSRVAR